MMYRVGAAALVAAVCLPVFAAHAGDHYRTFNWTGFYVGANAGVAVGEADTVTGIDSTIFGTPVNRPVYGAAMSPSFNPHGFSGGLQAGYNAQIGHVVLGGEVDFGAMRLDDSAAVSVAPPASVTLTSLTSVKTDWLFTVRTRVGFAADRLLVYSTGGLAMTNFKYAQFNIFDPACGGTGCNETGTSSSWKAGWTIGGGFELALTSNVTVKGEYLYADFGSVRTTGFDAAINQPFNHHADLTAHVARFGVNYKFGPRGEPVALK